MSCSYFYAIDLHFSKGRGKEKPSVLGKHHNGKQRNARDVSHLCCHRPAGPQCWCWSLAHLGTWDNWGLWPQLPAEEQGTLLAKELHRYLMTTEEVGGLVLFLGITSLPARKWPTRSLVPLCFAPGLSLSFVLALKEPELMPPFHSSPILTLLALIPPPASLTLIFLI